jgi:hypothetical protein
MLRDSLLKVLIEEGAEGIKQFSRRIIETQGESGHLQF